MMYLKLRNGRVKIGPADERGEDEIQEVIRIFRQKNLSAIDIETEFQEGHHGRYDGYHHQDNPYQRNPYGYSGRNYAPMWPDYTPHMNYQPPIIMPIMVDGHGNARMRRLDYDYDNDDRYPKSVDNPRRTPARPAEDEPKKAP